MFGQAFFPGGWGTTSKCYLKQSKKQNMIFSLENYYFVKQSCPGLN